MNFAQVLVLDDERDAIAGGGPGLAIDGGDLLVEITQQARRLGLLWNEEQAF